MITNGSLWRNKKNQHFYRVISGHAIDATNARDGTVVVIYKRADANVEELYDIFVRDRGEFYLQFVPADKEFDFDQYLIDQKRAKESIKELRRNLANAEASLEKALDDLEKS